MESSSRTTSSLGTVGRVALLSIVSSGIFLPETVNQTRKSSEAELRPRSQGTTRPVRSLTELLTQSSSYQSLRIMRSRASDGLRHRSNTTIASVCSSGSRVGRSGQREILRLSTGWTNTPSESKLLGSWGVSAVSTLRAIGRIPSLWTIRATKKIHRRPNRGIKPIRFSSRAWWKR